VQRLRTIEDYVTSLDVLPTPSGVLGGDDTGNEHVIVDHAR
jgi:hypothetical protein